MTEAHVRTPRAPLSALAPAFRLTCALALATALLLAGCGSEPPATLEIQRLDEPQRLLVEARSTVGDPYEEVEVLRAVSLEPMDSGAYVLRPRDVYVHGDRYGTLDDGTRVIVGSSAGLDRAAQAACQPHLTPYWGSTRANAGTRLDLGLLLPDGSFVCPSKVPADDEPSVDDALPFLLQRIPDEVLPLVAAHAPGTWPVGREVRVEVTVHRGDVLPPLEGTLRLRRSGGPSWKLHLKVNWRVKGKVASGLDWRVHHHVSGFLAVQPSGRIANATLSSRTRVMDGAEELGTSRHRFELSESEPTVQGDEARDLAQLLALREKGEEGKDAFDAAVLEHTAHSARALVQRVRPDASLEDVAVLLSDQVEPEAWPSGRPSTTANLDVCISLWARWAPTLDRLLGSSVAPGNRETILVANEEDARARGVAFDDEPWKPESESFAYAWPHLGRIAAGRAIASELRALCHEYGHVANERFGYPDLERTGFSWGNEGVTWIDLDGLLALALLEEAQAEATAVCAVLACYEPRHQRWVIRWYGRQDPIPALDAAFRDRVRSSAYGYAAAVLAPSCGVEDDLESTIRKTWAGYSYRTRQILDPRDGRAASRHWPRAQALREDGISDATRVGAFALLFHLDEGSAARREEALAIVRTLEDDVLLSAERGGHLWLTTWKDEASARRFAERVGSRSAGTVERNGRHVTLELGWMPEAEAWLRHLLVPEVAAEPVQGHVEGPAAAGSR